MRASLGCSRAGKKLAVGSENYCPPLGPLLLGSKYSGARKASCSSDYKG